MNDTPTLPRATELWAEVQKLAAERPDFRYNPDPDTPTMCFYSRGPTTDPARATGCLLGQGLQRLGVPQTYLARVDEQEIKLPADEDGEEPDDDTGIGNIWPLLIRLEDEADRAAHDRMCSAQSAQDRGESWGKAVAS